MIDKLISECTDYDFKESLEIDKPKSWLKSVSAFSNGIGGKIFFGITNSKVICGVDNPQSLIEKITDYINSKIVPVPMYKLTPYNENNKIFVELHVSSGISTPYYYQNENSRVAYIRSGSSSIIAPDYILNELILKGTGKTFDSLTTGLKKNDFIFSDFENDFFNRTGTKFTMQDYISFGLMTKDGYLTNAGLLFADNNILRQSRLFATKWNGNDKTNENEADDDKEFSGSLIKQLNSALDFFSLNTKIKWHKEGTATIYQPDYDKEAVMEALVNGLIHRNYNNTGAEVCLNIYDDRIEITSPGEMVSGNPIPSRVDYTFESMRRNPVIADVFWKMNYMNRRGSGLAKITNATAKLFKGDKNHVSFQIRNSFFVVTIDNANYKSNKYNKLNERQLKILELLEFENTISALANVIKADRKTIRSDLNLLESIGIVESKGLTKDKRWYLKK